MAGEPIREEKLVKDLQTKEVYHFVDSEKGIDQKSREIYKNKDLEVHYPIGFEGGPKYKNAQVFTFEGFGGALPVGIVKSAKFGLGFTSVLKSFIDYLEENFTIKEIVFLKSGTSSLDKNAKRLVLTESNFRSIYDVVKNLLDRQRDDRLAASEDQMARLFPKEVKKAARKYVKNTIASAVATWGNSLSEFSEGDRQSVKDLFDKLALTDGFFTADAVLKTKEAIDATYIDDVISQYEELMQQKHETEQLEKKWQKLLKKHSWIFSYIFAFPIILHQDEAFVGGKGLSNKDGKVTDFLVKNNLTENVAFVEIKTHKTELLKGGKPYRGSDVFSMSSDLTGGVAQVLNQRDNFQKHFATHRMNSPEVPFETFNSKCVVLMGSLADLDKKQIASFELFRSNSKDVEIITFDELLERFRSIKTLMAGKTP